MATRPELPETRPGILGKFNLWTEFNLIPTAGPMSLFSGVCFLPLRFRITLSLADTAVSSLDIRIGRRGFAVSWKRVAAPSKPKKPLETEVIHAVPPYPPPV